MGLAPSTSSSGADCVDLLAGVRVLDLTTFLSGPFCTQLLGDLGADVIKVEPPSGDSSRRIPPHFVGEDSAYFLSTNRNKRSVVVDLKQRAGIDVVERLIDASDVVVTVCGHSEHRPHVGGLVRRVRSP